MPLVTSRTQLSQGLSTTVAGAVFATGTGADIRIHTAAANNLPALAANEFFEVRNHTNSQNNGLYRVVTVTASTDDYECDKVNGLAPVTAAAESITTLGATGTEKSVFFDTAGGGMYGIEQGNVDANGIEGQAWYSFAMQEWKDDNFLIANSPFPMFAIDSDAGKYIIGQDASGNNSGFNFADNATFGIRTRKLMRNMGWDEVDSTGITTARYVAIKTLGLFEDPVNDNAYYRFGTDTTVNNTTDFTFNGPVNEAVKFYEEQPQTDLVITTTTITRIGGSFVAEGYVVGGQVTLRAANNAANNGTHVLTGVSATVLTTTGLTADAADTTARLAVNNNNNFKIDLRVRDGDVNGKTYGTSDLAAIGKTELGNFIFPFPLANVTDKKISATDAIIDGSAPYTGMTITYHSAPQSRGGLVGGPYDFGIIVDANNGTNVQVNEWWQRQLRSLSDIDNDADVHIGRAMDLLARFNGEVLEAGSPDGGLNFPNNPDGGGSGVYIDNLNAASANLTKFWDNTGALRSAPETIAVTLDFNATAINDVTTKFNLFYDRTIRTTASDIVLTGSTGKITSAGSNLPSNADIAINKYIRLSGMASASMDGVYQITAITTPGGDWTVVRYDGKVLADSASSSVTVDQYCIDTPDALIVDTNNMMNGATVSFTANNTIGDSANGFGIFAIGDRVRVAGTAFNDGIYEVATAAPGILTTVENTLSTEAAGGSVTVTQVFAGDAVADFTGNYDFDGNTQGGRTISITTYVKGKAVGSTGAQYTSSTVATIATGTPVTVPISSQIERNYA